MERAANGKYICPFNKECECDTPECHKCGWNPKVANRRVKAFRESFGLNEKKFKIPFTGYCEVWANNPADAITRANSGDMYSVHYDFGDAKCQEEEGANELD